LLGYKLNRIFFELNQQVSDANVLIQSQNEDLTRANAAKDQLFEIFGHGLKAPFSHLSALVTLSDHTDDQA
jgi:light-regulated signal transduction histidine kinase (bacteriophytochrome)